MPAPEATDGWKTFRPVRIAQNVPMASTTDPNPPVHRIPSGQFILTAAYDGVRSGVLTRWVQPCAVNPPLVMVAVSQGLAILPIIRDSRAFALCQIRADDRLLQRSFHKPPDRGDDPFITLPARILERRTGSPIIDRALSYLDCEVVRTVDLDADHRLYVGRIVESGLLNEGAPPAIDIGTNGVFWGSNSMEPPRDETPRD